MDRQILLEPITCLPLPKQPNNAELQDLISGKDRKHEKTEHSHMMSDIDRRGYFRDHGVGRAELAAQLTPATASCRPFLFVFAFVRVR